jgi:DNA-binding NtrC family response regulator
VSNERILIVDDEPDIRDVLRDVLEDENFSVEAAENAARAREIFDRERPDLALLDIWMPDTDGITLLKEWMELDDSVPVIMISGHGTVETAVEAIRVGAYDFLEKPLSTAKLLVTLQRALQNRRLRQENRALRRRLESSATLVGHSRVMADLRRQIDVVGKTESWVLVSGEPGSGKGVVARSLHQVSPRGSGPFVEVNLAAIPHESIPLQLFGSEEDGSVLAGRFEEAAGGTLVLDEIADLDLETQAKLLSALDEGAFLRLKGKQPVAIDVRVISTTNQDLDERIAQRRFREDLFYRLNVVPLRVPPLREHREDLPELIEFCLNAVVEREGLAYRRFTTGAINVLRNYHWPGNVRELRNLIQRLLIVGEGADVAAAEVESAIAGDRRRDMVEFPTGSFETSLRDARDRFEHAYFSYHLDQVGGNITELAQRAGMERTHLYRKLKGLGIDPKSHKNR